MNYRAETSSFKRVALVTGSSRGIGRAIAEHLARAGYAVCINYLERRDKAEELAALLTGQGCEAIAVQADVADRGAVNAANLDGGSSSLMYYNGEQITRGSNIIGMRQMSTAILILN